MRISGTIVGRWDDDRILSSLFGLFFAFALGMSSLVFPLAALNTGYATATIGFFYACSAVAQILSRLVLAMVLRRVSDRTVLLAAATFQAVGFVGLLFTNSGALIVLMWSIHGVGRSCFWTGSQAHVVRGTATAMKAMSVFNIFAGVGQLLGPLIAGILARGGIGMVVIAAVLVSLLAWPLGYALDRHAPFKPTADASRSATWRFRGIDVACGAGVTAGGWRGLMDSVVPAVLHERMRSSTIVGLLLFIANTAAVVGSYLVSRVGLRQAQVVFVVSTLAVGIGVGGFGWGGLGVVAAVFMLVTSALGAGVLQTMGPAVAALCVDERRAGDAIALYGSMRTVALFASPAIVSAFTVVAPPVVAWGVVSLVVTTPVTRARSVRGFGG